METKIYAVIDSLLPTPLVSPPQDSESEKPQQIQHNLQTDRADSIPFPDTCKSISHASPSHMQVHLTCKSILNKYLTS